MLILRSLRNSLRVLRNPLAEKVAAMEKQGTTVEEMLPLISGQGGKELLETGEVEGFKPVVKLWG
jgi:nitronate monooxygenase